MATLIIGLCLLLLGMAFFGFVRFLWASGPFRYESSWLNVVCVDENGDRIGKPERVRMPRPDCIETNGLNHVVKYVARLVRSRSERASVIIATPNGKKACLIQRDDGQLKICEWVYTGSSSRTKRKPFLPFPPHPPETEKEQAIRTLFADLGIAAEVDRVHEYNGYADAMRDLHYPIGNNIAQATAIVQRLLREVYQIQDSDGLDFTFSE